MVLLYRIGHMEENKFIYRFFIIIFIIPIILLIINPRLFRILFEWEFLDLISLLSYLLSVIIYNIIIIQG